MANHNDQTSPFHEQDNDASKIYLDHGEAPLGGASHEDARRQVFPRRSVDRTDAVPALVKVEADEAALELEIAQRQAELAERRAKGIAVEDQKQAFLEAIKKAEYERARVASGLEEDLQVLNRNKKERMHKLRSAERNLADHADEYYFRLYASMDAKEVIAEIDKELAKLQKDFAEFCKLHDIKPK